MVRTSLLDAGVRDKAKLASNVFSCRSGFFFAPAAGLLFEDLHELLATDPGALG